MAAYLVSIGTIQAGAILAVGNLIGNCFNSISMMLHDIVTLDAGKKVFEKLISKEKYIKNNNSNKIQLKHFNHDIIVENSSYNYNDTFVLKNLNLSFEYGKKYAIIGPSGCRKSTLLKILMGHITGNVLIDETSISSYDLKSINIHFAYIDQNVYLFNTSVLDNITIFNPNFDQENLFKTLEESSLKEFIDANKLAQNVGEDGKKLSGGQKQRISIARALLNKKKVIIMDEGTSASDKSNSSIVEEKLISNPYITLILVSHNLNEQLIDKFDCIYDLGKLNNIKASNI